MTDAWSQDDPGYADRRNLYKVEKLSRDGQRIEEMLFAGNGLAKAQRIFESFIARRPRSRLTIRQRTRVMMWPTGGLTLNRRCSAIAGPDDLQYRSWYKGDLHELTYLGSGHASPLARWRNEPGPHRSCLG